MDFIDFALFEKGALSFPYSSDSLPYAILVANRDKRGGAFGWRVNGAFASSPVSCCISMVFSMEPAMHGHGSCLPTCPTLPYRSPVGQILFGCCPTPPPIPLTTCPCSAIPHAAYRALPSHTHWRTTTPEPPHGLQHSNHGPDGPTAHCLPLRDINGSLVPWRTRCAAGSFEDRCDVFPAGAVQEAL